MVHFIFCYPIPPPILTNTPPKPISSTEQYVYFTVNRILFLLCFDDNISDLKAIVANLFFFLWRSVFPFKWTAVLKWRLPLFNARKEIEQSPVCKHLIAKKTTTFLKGRNVGGNRVSQFFPFYCTEWMQR